MRKTVLIPALLAATALSACATPRSSFTAPAVALPATYANGSATAAPAVGANWWESFGDGKLSALVERVLARNNDLAAAAILVRRAQLEARLTATNAIPTVSGGADASTGTDGQGQSYRSSASVAYEVDLFGKLGAERDAARWEARATQEDLAAARLSLVGTTLDLYWQLAALNQRIALAQANLAYVENVQKIVDVQHASGAASAIEVNEAAQSVEQQKADLSALVQSRVETRTALSLLLGDTAWSGEFEPPALPDQALPEVAAGAPADLLARRPDLQAAELRLRESLSGVDVSRASFYPSITLTGSAGGGSTQLSSLLANPTAVLGVGVDLPFLNWTQRSLDLKVSKADYERAAVEFRQTLLQAFGDVENALSARTQLAEQGARLQATLDAARKAEALYSVRYEAGAVALRIYLDAEQARRSAEQAVLTNRLAQLQAQSTLYQALGGGTV